jgi:hypothetical protein
MNQSVSVLTVAILAHLNKDGLDIIIANIDGGDIGRLVRVITLVLGVVWDTHQRGGQWCLAHGPPA